MSDGLYETVLLPVDTYVHTNRYLYDNELLFWTLHGVVSMEGLMGAPDDGHYEYLVEHGTDPEDAQQIVAYLYHVGALV